MLTSYYFFDSYVYYLYGTWNQINLWCQKGCFSMNETKVNIKGLDKGDVLFALWKGSHCQGVSFLGMTEGLMTIERARELVKKRAYWEWRYIHSKDNTDLPNDLVDVSEDDKEAFEEWYSTKPSFRCDFDYVDGHVIKCDLTGDEFDPRLYDRDCGEGRAEEVITMLRKGEEIKPSTPGEDELLYMLVSMFGKEDERE